MTYQTNRRVPAARAIDDFQDSISDPSVPHPRDWSGWILGGFVFGCLALALVLPVLQ